MGSTVGTAWWVGYIAMIWLIFSGWVCLIGAGNASIRGEVSISVSLDESTVWRSAWCLVYTIVVLDMGDDIRGKI
jgi:hypothetical protein